MGPEHPLADWSHDREITPAQKKAAIQLVETEYPALWQKAYPRIYREAAHGQYSSLKEMACDLVGAAIKIENGFFGHNEQAEIVWASQLARYRVPIYWITPDMAEAIKLTTPPDSIKISEIDLPFDAAVFALPRGTLVDKEGEEGEATFVSYARVRPGDDVPTLARGGPRGWILNQGSMAIFAHTASFHLLHWTFRYQDTVNLHDLDQLVQTYDGDTVTVHTSAFPFDQYFAHEITHTDNMLMARVAHFVFGTLLLMVLRPDLVTTGRLEKRVPQANLAPKEFWTPHIIGEHYKLRRLGIPQGGTHASPRGHWVRGFYRQQPYGPKLSLKKEIWIDPFWRGGVTDHDETGPDPTRPDTT